MIDRVGLADFLRSRRELLRPTDVGLTAGFGSRRTPGLRRDEVALLAGMSCDYYSRLEQCRGSHPSEPIVASLAIALRCTLDERDHLYHLAGLAPPTRRAGQHVPPALVSLAQSLTDVPVCICTDLDEMLWQNRLADTLLGRPDRRVGRTRNLTWMWFTEPAVRDRFPAEDWPLHAAAHVRDLRATHSRRSGESDVTALVTDLLARSPEFRDLWKQHEVAVHRSAHKRVIHPEVGLVDLTCQVLLTPDADLKVLAFFPVDGTDARDKLDLLRVIGTQSFQAAT